MNFGKFKRQCIRNGPTNPSLCPGSPQDTFIIVLRYSKARFSKLMLPETTISKITNLKFIKPWFTNKCPALGFPSVWRFTVIWISMLHIILTLSWSLLHNMFVLCNFRVLLLVGHCQIANLEKVKKHKHLSQNQFVCPIWQLSGFWQDRSVRENCAPFYGPRVSKFLSHRIVKSLIIMNFGKLQLQCTRNDIQKASFCPGSTQDTFSSISHQRNISK